MARGLIPLMLSSPDATSTFSSRSSVALTSPNRASHSDAVSVSPVPHRRNQSDVTPIIKLSRPPVRSSMKRSSQQLPASLPQIPFSSAEWKRAISEIKRYHVTRRYRACSARCNEILTNIKMISTVEPAYLIYLNFYAACSLEMCARPLAPASAYRISLLQEARAHYDRAAALIRAAEDIAIVRARSSSVASGSSLPSFHSPSNSISSSSAWTPESGLNTPTTPCTLSRKSSLTTVDSSSSISSTSTTTCTTRPPLLPTPTKKKQVSFELPRDRSRWSFTLPEPAVAVRPDSPTLGFDDEYFAAGAMRQELPELPAAAKKRTSASRPDLDTQQQQQQPPPLSSPQSYMPSISEHDELPFESPTAAADDDDDHSEYPSFFSFPGPPRARVEDESARALGRYCETLAALKIQVASHTTALDNVLGRDLELQEQAGVVPESIILHDGNEPQMSLGLSGSGGGGGNCGSRQSRRGSAAFGVIAGGARNSMSSSALGGGLAVDGQGEDGEEKVREERRARIDRLKQSGWRRKRFDASRYEGLCEAVMAELNHS